jgi:MFS family permease
MSVFSGARRLPARRVRPSLRDPRFAFLLIGQSVNAVGSWASAIVLWGFAAYRFNASPEAISVTVVCWSVPPAVLSSLTGGLADRFGPRALMIVGYLGAAAAALAMAAGRLAGLPRRHGGGLRRRPVAVRPCGQRAAAAGRVAR